MLDFLSGVSFANFALIAGFFYRFWIKTKDRFFLMFGLAFAMLAAERAILIVFDVPNETRTYVYLIRLLAFVLIIVGIIQKNREPSRNLL